MGNGTNPSRTAVSQRQHTPFRQQQTGGVLAGSEGERAGGTPSGDGVDSSSPATRSDALNYCIRSAFSEDYHLPPANVYGMCLCLCPYALLWIPSDKRRHF